MHQVVRQISACANQFLWCFQITARGMRNERQKRLGMIILALSDKAQIGPAGAQPVRNSPIHGDTKAEVMEVTSVHQNQVSLCQMPQTTQLKGVNDLNSEGKSLQLIGDQDTQMGKAATIFTGVLLNLFLYYMILYKQSGSFDLIQCIIYTLYYLLPIYIILNSFLSYRSGGLHEFILKKPKLFLFIYLGLLIYIISPLKPKLGTALEELLFFLNIPISFFFVTISFLLIRFYLEKRSSASN